MKPKEAACPQCGMVLDQSLIAKVTGAPRQRVPTMTEFTEPARPSPPRIDYRPSPPLAPPSYTSAAAAAPGPVTAAGRRQTVLMPSAAYQPLVTPSVPASTVRRIIAVLITYSWKPEGQLFPVRQGRNLIGRGEECDIQIPEDVMLSQVNTHITFRQTFTVGDMVSMGGTYLNGEAVEEQFRPLKNMGLIRAGSTQFAFFIIDPNLISDGS